MTASQPSHEPPKVTALETRAVPTWRCTICSNVNPDDGTTHCRQCEYSRMILRDGREVPRDGYR